MGVVSGGVEVHPQPSISECSPIVNCIRETFHSFDISINMGKARVEFITTNDLKLSGEIIPMVVLVTDRLEEGNLGKVTTFCHHDQSKVV